jgi:hypothetical protein
MFAKHHVAAAAIAAMMMGLCGGAVAREEVPYIYGGDLAKDCAAPDQTIEYAICAWFVMGALEVIVNNPSYGLSACPPHMINGPQAVKLTRLWLAAHPEQELRPGSYSVAAAVAAAFPCKK